MVSKTYLKGRYSETDQMGIIHHSVYAIWYEIARNNYISEVGITYKQIEASGIMMPIVKIESKYIFPAYFDDEILIETVLESITVSRIVFNYTLKNVKNNKIINKGKTMQCFVNNKTFVPLNFKKANPKLFLKLSELVKNTDK